MASTRGLSEQELQSIGIIRAPRKQGKKEEVVDASRVAPLMEELDEMMSSPRAEMVLDNSLRRQSIKEPMLEPENEPLARVNDREPPMMEDSLTTEVETDNNIKSVSKELFNKREIELKTEVSHDEINNISRIRFLSERYGIQNTDVLVDTFLSLRVSKDRKSRKEFIDALQTENRNVQGGGLGKLFGFNGNKQQG